MKESAESILAESLLEALKLCAKQEADGVSRAERMAGFERTVRASWPQRREWKFICHECADVGLVIYECDGGSRCGRTNPHLAHSFGEPCLCKHGKRFRPKPQSSADVETAGKSRKPSRFGR